MIHLAAISAVGDAASDPATAHAINVGGTRALLEAGAAEVIAIDPLAYRWDDNLKIVAALLASKAVE